MSYLDTGKGVYPGNSVVNSIADTNYWNSPQAHLKNINYEKVMGGAHLKHLLKRYLESWMFMLGVHTTSSISTIPLQDSTVGVKVDDLCYQYNSTEQKQLKELSRIYN